MSKESYGYYSYGSRKTRSGHGGKGLPIALFFCGAVFLFYGLTIEGSLPFSTPLIMGFTIAIFVYMLTFTDPRIGLAVTLLAIGVSPELSVSGMDLRLEDFVIPAVFFAWITKHLINRSHFVTSPWNKPLYLFLFFGAVSTFIALSEQSISTKTSLLHYFKQLEYVLLFYIVLNNIKTEKEIKAFIILIFVCSAIASIGGLRQAMTLGAHANDAALARVTGPQGETANIWGAYLIFHIILAAGFLPYAKTMRGHIVLLALLLLLSVPMIYTLSRTSYISLFMGFFFIGVFANRKMLVGLVMVCLALPAFLPGMVKDRLGTLSGFLVGEYPSSWTAKTSMWGTSIKTVRESPLFGKGFGSINLGAIDNEYFKVAIESGLLGLFILLALLFITIKTAFYISRTSSNRLYKAYSVGYLGGAVALMIHSIAATTLTTIRTAETFYFATGILMVIYVAVKQEDETPAKTASEGDLDDQEPPEESVASTLYAPDRSSA